MWPVTNTLPMDAVQAARKGAGGRPAKPGSDTSCPQGLADTRLPLAAPATSLDHSPVLCEGAHAICVSANRAGSLVDPTAEKGLTPPSAPSLRVCRLGRSYKAGLRDGLALEQIHLVAGPGPVSLRVRRPRSLASACADSCHPSERPCTDQKRGQEDGNRHDSLLPAPLAPHGL